MVTFSTVLDTSQKTHWCVTSEVIVEGHCIEVFNCYPSENGSKNCQSSFTKQDMYWLKYQAQ